MTKPTWKEIVEFVGITAIVASLVFVGIQIKQDRETTLSEVRQFNASTFVELQIAIADHAEALAKSNRGEKLSESEAIAMHALVDAMHRHVIVAALETRQQGGTGRATMASFAIWLHLNPGARAIWMQQRSEITQRTEMISSDLDFIRQLYDEILDALTLLDENGS